MPDLGLDYRNGHTENRSEQDDIMNRFRDKTPVLRTGLILALFSTCPTWAIESNPAPAAPATCREVVPAEDWAGAGCRGDCLNMADINIAKKQPSPDVPGVEARNERPEVTVSADVVKSTELPPCFEADYPSSAPSRYSRFLE